MIYKPVVFIILLSLSGCRERADPASSLSATQGSREGPASAPTAAALENPDPAAECLYRRARLQAEPRLRLSLLKAWMGYLRDAQELVDQMEQEELAHRGAASDSESLLRGLNRLDTARRQLQRHLEAAAQDYRLLETELQAAQWREEAGYVRSNKGIGRREFSRPP